MKDPITLLIVVGLLIIAIKTIIQVINVFNDSKKRKSDNNIIIEIMKEKYSKEKVNSNKI